MKWRIPAKTFLIGEYVALSGGPAVILTTAPCFEMTEMTHTSFSFHPDSPAGLFVAKNDLMHRLSWLDPYHGLGGLGASSAQFVGAYLAYCQMKNQECHVGTLLDAYQSLAYHGEGIPPSGYDVLAQAHDRCVLIDQGNIISMDWPFPDIGFILLHTQKKLATHEHLQHVFYDSKWQELEIVARKTYQDFLNAHQEVIEGIREYHKLLTAFGLVAPSTLELINTLQQKINPLAIKGCGAMGADVVLALVDKVFERDLAKTLREDGYQVLATSVSLYFS